MMPIAQTNQTLAACYQLVKIATEIKTVAGGALRVWCYMCSRWNVHSISCPIPVVEAAIRRAEGKVP